MSFYGQTSYTRPSYQDRPRYATTRTPRTTGTASDAALRFMDSLVAQHPLNTLSAPLVSLITARNASPATFTPAQASFCIDALKALPRPQAPEQNPGKPAPAPAEIGFYLLDGEVYKVRAGKQDPSRTYAMKLILPTNGGKGTFAYAPGAIRNLSAENRLTVDEARTLGHASGVCMICGAPLTDPRSVEQGIGPICITRL